MGSGNRRGIGQRCQTGTNGFSDAFVPIVMDFVEGFGLRTVSDRFIRRAGWLTLGITNARKFYVFPSARRILPV